MRRYVVGLAPVIEDCGAMRQALAGIAGNGGTLQPPEGATLYIGRGNDLLLPDTLLREHMMSQIAFWER